MSDVSNLREIMNHPKKQFFQQAAEKGVLTLDSDDTFEHAR